VPQAWRHRDRGITLAVRGESPSLHGLRASVIAGSRQRKLDSYKNKIQLAVADFFKKNVCNLAVAYNYSERTVLQGSCQKGVQGA